MFPSEKLPRGFSVKVPKWEQEHPERERRLLACLDDNVITVWTLVSTTKINLTFPARGIRI